MQFLFLRGFWHKTCLGDQRDGQSQFAVTWQVTGMKADWAILFTPTQTGGQEKTYLYTSLFIIFSVIKAACCSLAPFLNKGYAAVLKGISVLVEQEKEDSPQQ